MQKGEPTDAAFADEVLAQLERVEPSASLMRRVAEIPITVPSSAPDWLPWHAWPTRLLLLGALALGALVGGLPWEATDAKPTDGDASSEMATADGEEELEEALSLAFGSDWLGMDAFSEESL